MATNSFIQVPPDGAGKKLFTKQHVVGANTVQGQVFHLSDPTNPEHIQTVDALGQANVRFAEGSPTMDAFGALRVSNAMMVGSYEHSSGDMNDQFTNTTRNSGYLSFLPYSSAMVLGVTSASGSLSERTTNRYHYYQPGVGNFVIMTLSHSDQGKANNSRRWGYGNSLNGLFFKLDGTTLKVSIHSTTDHLPQTKTATGTNGSSQLTLSDTNDLVVGMYLAGAGITFESQISNIAGNVVTLTSPLYDDVSGPIPFFETTIDDVPQASWNGDKLDGTGLSDQTIDLTKANFYWMDFAWLGVGAVRFGIMGEDGARITCHTFRNPNNKLGAYMQSGSRPIHFKNINTGATSGSSEMKLICSAVYAEARLNYTFYRRDDIERLAPVTVTTDTHLLTAKPKLILDTGLPNRIGSYPDCLRILVTGGTVKLSIVDDATLSAPTWGIVGDGVMQGDISDSSVTGGTYFKSWYLGPGSHNIDVSSYYEVNDEGYHVKADTSDSKTFTLVATKLDGATVTASAGLTYRELR